MALGGSRSLRQPHSLHSGTPQEAGLPTQDTGPRRASSPFPHQEQATRKRGWRAASLRAPKAGRDEALGEATHSLGPGDGQRLITEPPRLAGDRVKRCRQQVQRSLRQGWETFVTNLNSLTLSLPVKKTKTVAGPSQVAGDAP